MSWTLSIYSHKVTCVHRILDLIQTVFNIFYISSWASSSPFWVNFSVTIFLVSFSDYKSRLHILLLFNFLHTHIYISDSQAQLPHKNIKAMSNDEFAVTSQPKF